ncbi:hypothetical protein ACGFNU_16930 [Spirillospora sp. NPDC048911]|uniref:hypothetical protein n=1 Tax=Spirillospora sp. NPDC048911 TaxID=3364527 RepID=UPI0037195054
MCVPSAGSRVDGGWARDETFSVTLPPRGTVTFPTWDLTEAAEAIVQCSEDLDAG